MDDAIKVEEGGAFLVNVRRCATEGRGSDLKLSFFFSFYSH